MVCTRDIRIKVTELQYKIIKGKAELGGYKTISAFIRDCVLNVDFSMEKLIKQIHELVVEKKNLK
ncbi:MAG: hypothetical protein Q8R47_06680 [Nanoarchaeota archaeon]|nr:hypothetical protein [Nanoarchaeota archaeon]